MSSTCILFLLPRLAQVVIILKICSTVLQEENGLIFYILVKKH